MILIPSPPPAKSQVQNFLKNGGLARYVLGADSVPIYRLQVTKKKAKKVKKKLTVT